MLFRYKGINVVTGERVHGEIDCSGIEALEQHLRLQQIELLHYQTQKPLKTVFKRKLSKRELALFTEQMSFLLNSGIALLDALDELKLSHKGMWFFSVVEDIAARIRNGEHFYQALENYPSCFDSLYIKLISLAEKNACLPQMMIEISLNLQWQLSLKQSLKKVLTYPVILVCVLLLVLIFVMNTIVPSLLGFIESIDGEIGWSTQLLLSLSDLWGELGWTSFAWPMAFLTVIYLLYRKNARFRAYLHRLWFRLPFSGNLTLYLKMAQIFKTLALMLEQKSAFSTAWHEVVPLAESNLYLRRIFGNIENEIQSGSNVYTAVSSDNWLPSAALSMIKMGELGGKLDIGFMQASQYLESEARRRLEKVQPLIEPFVTLLMGLIIGWIVLAVLGPVYDSIDKLQ
ncbi:type II secretion system F family protein [Thiomicrorhabdus heinhorstiae]|uniref:Type II secretion system F family protein n=1 Tax=Thiomicrorhabdus heinhorstiae TaxID=2748010 RepID=A0ABS0BZE8_9GAMM|nr:type II secretion system F family protein [Thiomicrorhabdus heinhorstiae]MBF6058433.1 type II secretion system F family protein [Thiomicrorhabdus heinhorstiae]